MRATFEKITLLFTGWKGCATTGVVVEEGALGCGTTDVVEARALAGALALVALTVGALTVGTLGLSPVEVLAGAMVLGALAELDF